MYHLIGGVYLRHLPLKWLLAKNNDNNNNNGDHNMIRSNKVSINEGGDLCREHFINFCNNYQAFSETNYYNPSSIRSIGKIYPKSFATIEDMKGNC